MDDKSSAEELMEAVTRCPVCSSEKRKFLFEICRDGINSTICKCDNCRLVYNGTRLKNKKDSEYLETKFSDNYAKQYCEQYAHAKEYLRGLLGKINGKKMLDVGCGPGLFITAAQELGFDAVGIEPFEPSARIAKAAGLPVLNTFLSNADLPKKSFDLILAMEVIEHFSEPVKEFQVMSSLIKDDGLIVLQTANQDSFAAWIKGKKRNYYYYDHLCYFSPQTLEYALNKANLHIVGKYAGVVPFWKHFKSMPTWKKKLHVIKLHFFRMLVFNKPILSSMTLFVKKKDF